MDGASNNNYKGKIDEIKKTSIQVFTLRDRSCNIQTVKEISDIDKDKSPCKIQKIQISKIKATKSEIESERS